MSGEVNVHIAILRMVARSQSDGAQTVRTRRRLFRDFELKQDLQVATGHRK